MLAYQKNPETEKRFKNLKYGDILKIRELKDIVEENRRGKILCSWNVSMNETDLVLGKKIIVFERMFFSSKGIYYNENWKWSLDMMEYAMPYVVDLL